MNNLRTFEEWNPWNLLKKKKSTDAIRRYQEERIAAESDFGRPNDPYKEENWNDEEKIKDKIHCPACGSDVTYEERYDWQVCNNCGDWFL
jgi:hypothetical protein